MGAGALLRHRRSDRKASLREPYGAIGVGIVAETPPGSPEERAGLHIFQHARIDFGGVLEKTGRSVVARNR